jgi:hypothetical protein
VHDRDDEDKARIRAIENRVRKAFDDLSAKIAIDDRSYFGARLNPPERVAEMVTKSLAEALSPGLIEWNASSASP